MTFHSGVRIVEHLGAKTTPLAYEAFIAIKTKFQTRFITRRYPFYKNSFKPLREAVEFVRSLEAEHYKRRKTVYMDMVEKFSKESILTE